MFLNREFGDYQTPIELTDKIVKLLFNKYKINPQNIIEPTIGIGNFITSCVHNFPNVRNVWGIDINETYLNLFRNESAFNKNINYCLSHASVFEFNFNDVAKKIDNQSSLIISNPPWVTNSDLTSSSNNNLPKKSNFKNESGFDSVTGKGNFDICEFIIIQMIKAFKNIKNCYFSFLCKNIVARNLLRDLNKFDVNIDLFDLYEFNAQEYFQINSEAVLIVLRNGNENTKLGSIYNLNNPTAKIKTFGWGQNKKFVSNIDSYKPDLEGKGQLNWRIGIKHDCKKVMELIKQDTFYINSYNDKIASDYIYPLIKSSDLKSAVIKSFKRGVIVTQQFVGQDTNQIQEYDIDLWKYLIKYKNDFDKRKSIIYKNKPPYSIFAIGKYAFSKYKVVVSGFYKKPKFSLVYHETKPVMVDDTCYYLSFDNYKFALIIMVVLNEKIVFDFLDAITFSTSKRPFTKESLQRIDLIKLINLINKQKLLKQINEIDKSILLEDIDNLLQYLNNL